MATRETATSDCNAAAKRLGSTHIAKGEIMGSVSKKTTTKPPPERQPMCNDDILRLLADHRGRSVSEMATHFGVTQTAIRKRLVRLAAAQSVIRKRDDAHRGQGRPKYLYYLTSPDAAALVLKPEFSKRKGPA
jgi:hypothetical protein